MSCLKLECGENHIKGDAAVTMSGKIKKYIQIWGIIEFKYGKR